MRARMHAARTRCAHESAEAGSWLLILLCLFRLQVLDTAAKYNLRLIIALVNNWDQDSNADNKCAAHVACTGSCLMCSEQSQPLTRGQRGACCHPRPVLSAC